jgi:hypothetical protein
MAKALTRTALLTSQSLAAGGTARATLNLSGTGYDGGAVITLRITNGASGPSSACEGRVLLAHMTTGDSVPASAAEGTGDQGWKMIYKISGGTANNDTARGLFFAHPAMGALEIEFTGHAGQAVTVEAHATGVS